MSPLLIYESKVIDDYIGFNGSMPVRERKFDNGSMVINFLFLVL